MDAIITDSKDVLASYFNDDQMAADTWADKYQMKDKSGNPVEKTPDDMHRRLAKEFARIEYQYKKTEESNRKGELGKLSQFGYELFTKRKEQSLQDIEEEFYKLFKDFKHIVPQGSIMSNLGNDFVFGSLSNCFVVASPTDSYSGIMKTDEELAQLMKRRGGVGTTLDPLRPTGAAVTNASRISTGIPTWAERYSNTTREVAMEGRRGALMLLLSVQHPDIFRYVTMKEDRTKVTGANISVMFTDEFMKKVENQEDFYCTFPVNAPHPPLLEIQDDIEYNQLIDLRRYGWRVEYAMKIKAHELFDTFVEMAWSNAEPGAAYIDRVQDYCPDGVYERFKPTKCNPCGEIWMGDYDACRLIAQNLFSLVYKPFSDNPSIVFDEVYEYFYMQQRLSDNLIDLEAESIDRILDKIRINDQSVEIKRREIELWTKIKETTLAGRRTGNGITGLGDMLAAMNLPYDSEEGIGLTKVVMHYKMKGELDATIDMAILRGPFDGWNTYLEFGFEDGIAVRDKKVNGNNSFFQMLCDEFPHQAYRMYQYGRRNVSWSTVAPTGTVSIMTQTTGGLEPLFKAYYIRRKKINPNDRNVRIDFVDQNGDSWQEYPVLHPKFREWCLVTAQFPGKPEYASKEQIQLAFQESPWYGSEADDISWEKRVEMQAIIQKYTSNAISSTINLPKDVSKEVVHNIYMQAWKKGLKGVTIYREGSRTGVLVSDNKITTQDSFGYNDAIKRPDELEADYYCVHANGHKYAVVVGLLNNNPYELFAFEDPVCEGNLKGKIVKVRRGVYSFQSSNYNIENLQLSSEYSDEKLLTRWVSLLLRHGANPKFIADQVEKSQVAVVSFPKAVARVLKNYVPDEQIKGELCSNCQQSTMIYQEGCKKCTNCGHSKC